MNKVEVFLDNQIKYSEAIINGNEKLAETYAIKNRGAFKTFTKADWEELIAQSHGRAKYEYTKMMNEKFPTGK